MPAAVAPVEKALPIIPKRDASALRRFELGDLSRHGGWLMARLTAAFPRITSREMQGWLRGIVYSNEFCFLYQDNSVGLAQVVRTFTLTPKPVVQERFVFVEDKDNPEHVEQAANFDEEFGRWAKNKDCETILVEELTDVPHELIKDRLGRLFTKQQTVAKV